jgi:hypothetical protein
MSADPAVGLLNMLSDGEIVGRVLKGETPLFEILMH